MIPSAASPVESSTWPRIAPAGASVNTTSGICAATITLCGEPISSPWAADPAAIGQIAKPGLAHFNCLRPNRNVGDLEAPISIGQRAGVGVAFNAHQRPRQPFAGRGIAHHSVQRRQRAVQRHGLRRLLLILRGVLSQRGQCRQRQTRLKKQQCRR